MQLLTKKSIKILLITILLGLDISTRPPAGNFHGGQVKFHKYPARLAGTFFSLKVRQITVMGRFKENFGLVALASARKITDPALYNYRQGRSFANDEGSCSCPSQDKIPLRSLYNNIIIIQPLLYSAYHRSPKALDHNDAVESKLNPTQSI